MDEKPRRKHRKTGNPHNTPKNPPQTEEQMIAVIEERKKNQMFRSKESEKSANEEAIGKIVGFAYDGILNVIANNGRVSLSDTYSIQQITGKYLEVCSSKGMVPTMVGLSMAIGCTSGAISDHIRRHPDSESAAWFRYMKVVFAEILSQSMLSGKTVPIPSIFVLKAQYHWSDEPPEDLNENAGKDKVDAKTIMEKYGDLPE